LNRKFFGLHPKVKLPQLFYACIFVVITLVGPAKVSIMKLKCTELNRMWQHDFMTKQIFFSSVFLSENTGRLAKQAGYLGHNPWHTRYISEKNLICNLRIGQISDPQHLYLKQIVSISCQIFVDKMFRFKTWFEA
jgi:hypothetical protein